ncbi:protein of unknown function (plasmid) [Methylocella tundrae]|uniref:Uncharacterized protein n=1 Tax=Methylocella tundrae TaxID=227605 RepID=A0A4U8Z6V2_METTU|nr:protein of unknown function [Methylocella tundrae]
MKTTSTDGRGEGRRDDSSPRSGRPTKAAAAQRDERLLEIATDMFLKHGFDGTSMERLGRGRHDRQGDALCALCR